MTGPTGASGGARNLLLLRHRDLTWGVENERVQQVDRERSDGLFRVVLWDSTRSAAGTRLAVEEVRGVATEVAVTWAVRVLSRFWSEPVRGLAVHGGSPVVVLDPDEPPGPLTDREMTSEGG